MRLRSLLFVPGDSERKFAKAKTSDADVLILDLEDSVTLEQKEKARGQLADFLADSSSRPWQFFVRVNALDSGLMLADLTKVVKPGLDAILVPKAKGMRDLEHCGHYLDALEAKAGMAAGSVKLAVIATETARAMLNIGSYAVNHPRLVAVTWGAEDLAADLGVRDNKDSDGRWAFPYQMARTQCLFAATATEAAPIDTVYVNFRDLDGFEEDCRCSRRDGFLGRLAIHPDQVAIINRCYMPSDDEIAHARRIIEAFEINPTAGAVNVDGKMVDIPHLKAARKILSFI